MKLQNRQTRVLWVTETSLLWHLHRLREDHLPRHLHVPGSGSTCRTRPRTTRSTAPLLRNGVQSGGETEGTDRVIKAPVPWGTNRWEPFWIQRCRGGLGQRVVDRQICSNSPQV